MRFGGDSTLSTPGNREIGFVSSSFSFRVVRASGRGEAVRRRVRKGQGNPLLSGPSGSEFRRSCSSSPRRLLDDLLWQVRGF